MPRILCKYPFTGGYVFNFNKKQNRRTVDIYEDDSVKKRTMTYARYLMCVKEGRILETEEHVHHKDDDTLNDDIKNLEILLKKDHERKHNPNMDDVVLRCPACSKEFTLKAYDYRYKSKYNNNIICSRACSNRMKTIIKRIKMNEYLNQINRK